MQSLFKPVAWSYDTNLYEVNVRQYTPEGTFAAFAKHFPRLKDMAVEVLWFMPITPISIEKRQGTLGSYYACSDYTAVNPEFGTVEDFKEMVEQAHGFGFKVIIDWVANHTGWDHIWTKISPQFYKRNSQGHFYDSNNWHDVIDLNYYDHALRREIIAAMRFWVEECNIDGFRCDMAHLVPLDFWRQARFALDAIKPLFWLAETEHPNYSAVFDCTYAWHWMHQTEKFCKGTIGLQALTESLVKYTTRLSSHPFQLFFTTNHDENSWNGSEYEKYGHAAKALAVFSCTWDGLPLIYSGQEMPNRKRLKFFDKDPIEWTGKFELHNFYRTLLQLRKNNPALRAGDINEETFFINTDANDLVLAYARKLLEKEVLVFLNLSSKSLDIDIKEERVAGIYKNIFTGESNNFSRKSTLSLDPWDYAVFER